MFQLCTNFLFGLCKFVWVIDCLSFFLVSSRSSNTPLYPQNATNQRACPNSWFFYCFHFIFTFESIKELGSALVSLFFKAPRLVSQRKSMIIMSSFNKGSLYGSSLQIGNANILEFTYSDLTSKFATNLWIHKTILEFTRLVEFMETREQDHLKCENEMDFTS